MELKQCFDFTKLIILITILIKIISMINQSESTRHNISCRYFIDNTKLAIGKLFCYLKHIFKKDPNNQFITENMNQTLITTTNDTIVNDNKNISTNSTIVPFDTIDHDQTINENDILFKMKDTKLNIKILYFALIIKSDEIKKILEINNIDLQQIFSSDLTFKSEHHVTLWYAASSNIEIIETYYNEIKDLIGTMQLITITKFSHNSRYGRLNISFHESNNLHNFYKGDSKAQPHITLVHPDRDAVGAGTFISTDEVDLNVVIETKVAVIVKNKNKIETIIR